MKPGMQRELLVVLRMLFDDLVLDESDEKARDALAGAAPGGLQAKAPTPDEKE